MQPILVHLAGIVSKSLPTQILPNLAGGGRDNPTENDLAQPLRKPPMRRCA